MILADEDSGTVGELIRRYRQTLGLTQEELSEKADLSVRAVRYLEQGKVHRPRKTTLQRLALALGLNNMDQARLIAAARMIELPLTTAATAGTDTASWPPERLGFQLLLALLIEQFGTERLLVVSVVMASRTCCGCAETGAGRGLADRNCRG